MINEKNIERAKKMIKDCEEKPIVVMAQDDHFNRKMLEYGKFDILLSVESRNRKNKLKQIDSGMNEFIAKLAKKKSISFGLDIKEILILESKEKAERLMKIKQNLILCRKNGCKIVLFNCKDKINAFSLLLSLGATSKQAKEAISF